ncbi:MAG: hypothetical protein R2774_01380 [Saprospiraceae bacterium]
MKAFLRKINHKYLIINAPTLLPSFLREGSGVSKNPKYMYTSPSFFSQNLITNIIACLCIILISSCNKDPYQDGTPELPPITMEGKNTLGFLLDGKVWVPYQENPGIFTPTLVNNIYYSKYALLKTPKTKKSPHDLSYGDETKKSFLSLDPTLDYMNDLWGCGSQGTSNLFTRLF